MNQLSGYFSDAMFAVRLDTDILEGYMPVIKSLIKSGSLFDAAKTIEAVPISLQNRSELVEQKVAAATAAKEYAGACYMDDNFDDAIKYYSIAIRLDDTNHIYYSSRSGAYHKIGSWTCAIADARKVDSNC